MGPDLARCIVRIDKRRHPENTPAAAGSDGDHHGDVETDADNGEGESEVEEKRLPLSA